MPLLSLELSVSYRLSRPVLTDKVRHGICHQDRMPHGTLIMRTFSAWPVTTSASVQHAEVTQAQVLSVPCGTRSWTLLPPRANSTASYIC